MDSLIANLASPRLAHFLVRDITSIIYSPASWWKGGNTEFYLYCIIKIDINIEVNWKTEVFMGSVSLWFRSLTNKWLVKGNKFDLTYYIGAGCKEVKVRERKTNFYWWKLRVKAQAVLLSFTKVISVYWWHFKSSSPSDTHRKKTFTSGAIPLSLWISLAAPPRYFCCYGCSWAHTRS